MATIKIQAIEDKTKKKISVKLKISHKGERKQIQLFKVGSKYWDQKNKKVRKSHRDYLYLNSIILDNISRFTKRIDKLNTSRLGKFSISDILNTETEYIKVSQLLEQYSENLDYKTARKYKNLKDKILSYFDTEVVNVNKEYLKGFVSSLKKDKNINSDVTIHRYINFLKTALRQSQYVKEEALNFKVKKGSSYKPKLTREEFYRISKVNILELSRDAFSLCLFLWGSRIGDVLQLREENIKGEWIEFIEQKTQKIKRIPIDENIKEILTRYKGESNYGYLLPILERKWINPRRSESYQKHIEVKTAKINKDLKVIVARAQVEKKVSTHVARHTFASWADTSDINSRTIQKMMNFSSLSIMENYLEEIRKDELLKATTSRIFGSDISQES